MKQNYVKRTTIDCARAVAGVLLAASATSAVAAEPAATAACDAVDFASTLVPAVSTDVVPARAVWLSQSLIRWPGAPAQGRYALVSSLRAALVAKVGERVTGADDRLPLSVSGEPLSPALAQRFKVVASGVLLRAPDPARVARALRGQALVVREDDEGRVLEASALQMAGALDDGYAAAASLADLGATRDARGRGLAIWAPTAQAVRACVYPSAEGKASAVVDMRRDDATGAWRARLSTTSGGRYYTYLVDVVVPGVGLVRNRVTDPYSVSLNADSRRSWLGTLDDAATQPRDWRRDAAPATVRRSVDMAIYELHLRDFSIGDTSAPPPIAASTLRSPTRTAQACATCARWRRRA